MPGDEYASVVRGGLKLKGGAPAGVKKKKKKSKAPSTSTESKSSALEAALGDEDPNSSPSKDIVLKKGKGKAPEDDELVPEDDDHEDLKTASERAHEEMRRKRLHERLEKEGVKTHKQRVEELNKYLSNLSEHHDMPRIGPG